MKAAIIALLLSGLLLSSCSVRLYNIEVSAKEESHVEFTVEVDAAVDKPVDIKTDADLDLSPIPF